MWRFNKFKIPECLDLDEDLDSGQLCNCVLQTSKTREFFGEEKDSPRHTRIWRFDTNTDETQEWCVNVKNRNSSFRSEETL